MSTLDEPFDDSSDEDLAPVRGAQTVAPVQASALQFAASILGEGSYTPSQQLSGTLTAPARVHEVQPAVAEVVTPAPVAPAPVAPPVVEELRENAPVTPKVPESAPVAKKVRESVPVVQEPAPVAPRVVESTPTKGWFGRLLDKLLGRS